MLYLKLHASSTLAYNVLFISVSVEEPTRFVHLHCHQVYFWKGEPA